MTGRGDILLLDSESLYLIQIIKQGMIFSLTANLSICKKFNLLATVYFNKTIIKSKMSNIKIAIVISDFNEEITSRMEKKAVEVAEKLNEVCAKYL